MLPGRMPAVLAIPRLRSADRRARLRRTVISASTLK
jgi:hypothetical protein